MTAVSEFLEKYKDFTPWSTTKIAATQCPYYTNKVTSLGHGDTFKDLDVVNVFANEYLEGGLTVHDMMENWNRHHVYGDRLKTAGEMLASKKLSTDEMLLCSRQYKKTKNHFQYNEDGTPKFDGGKVLLIEEYVGLDKDGNPTTNPDEVFFGGTMDLVQGEQDGEILITDYKRQFNILSETDIAKKFQTKVYLCILARMFNATKVTFRMYFLRWNTWRDVSVSGIEAALWWDEICDVAEARQSLIETWKDNPIAIPGDFCSLCFFANECPALSLDSSETGVIRNSVDASIAAGLLLIGKKRVSEGERLLKAWCSNNGNVQIGDSYFGYHVSENPSWNVTNHEEFDKIVSGQNSKPQAYKNYKSDKLKSIMKKAEKEAAKGKPELLSSLSEHVNPFYKTTFKAKKA